MYSPDLSLPQSLQSTLDGLKTDDPHLTAAKVSQWIQDNVRYFGVEWGMNSHLPSSPIETYNRRYGDCKDKSVLLIAALNHVGIKAYPALVSSTNGKGLPDEIPSPGSFDHVIITFQVGGADYWVDATSSSQRGSLAKMSFPDLHWGLVIKDNANALTPLIPTQEEQLRGKIIVKKAMNLTEKGSLDTISLESNYIGWQAEYVRRYMSDMGIQRATESHRDYIATYFPEVNSSGQLLVTDNQELNSITLTENYSATKLTEVFKGNDRFVSYATDILDNIWLPNIRQRKTPFILPYSLDVSIEIEINLDEPDRLLWLDEENIVAEENEWFSYTRKVAREEKKITISHDYSSLQTEVSAEKFGSYARILESIEPSLQHSMILKRNAAFKNNDARAKSLIQSLLKKQ